MSVGEETPSIRLGPNRKRSRATEHGRKPRVCFSMTRHEERALPTCSGLQARLTLSTDRAARCWAPGTTRPCWPPRRASAERGKDTGRAADTSRAVRFASLGTMLGLGLRSNLVGLSVLIGLVGWWSAHGFGPIRSVLPAVVGTSLTVTGTQGALGGFLLPVDVGNAAVFPSVPTRSRREAGPGAASSGPRRRRA